eukprot:m.30508 g.30508  ORF g.30508 m.30508 type:complete len:259 (+) comp4783_c0_seq2:994-1770(+)
MMASRSLSRCRGRWRAQRMPCLHCGRPRSCRRFCQRAWSCWMGMRPPPYYTHVPVLAAWSQRDAIAGALEENPPSEQDLIAAIAAAVDNANVELLQAILPESVAELYPEGAITPLHIAAVRGFNAIIDVLLAAGLDVNTRDQHGRTPLHYAVYGKRVATARHLREKGANLSACDANGRTAADLARPAHNQALSQAVTHGRKEKESKDETPARAPRPAADTPDASDRCVIVCVYVAVCICNCGVRHPGCQREVCYCVCL